MRQVLAPNLARIARRAMRHGTEEHLALTQPIRDWAERLAPDGLWPQAGGQERLTEQVAEAPLEAVMDRLLPMPSLAFAQGNRPELILLHEGAVRKSPKRGQAP